MLQRCARQMRGKCLVITLHCKLSPPLPQLPQPCLQDHRLLHSAGGIASCRMPPPSHPPRCLSPASWPTPPLSSLPARPPAQASVGGAAGGAAGGVAELRCACPCITHLCFTECFSTLPGKHLPKLKAACLCVVQVGGQHSVRRLANDLQHQSGQLLESDNLSLGVADAAPAGQMLCPNQHLAPCSASQQCQSAWKPTSATRALKAHLHHGGVARRNVQRAQFHVEAALLLAGAGAGQLSGAGRILQQRQVVACRVELERWAPGACRNG